MALKSHLGFGSELYGRSSPKRKAKVFSGLDVSLYLEAIKWHGLAFLKSDDPWLGMDEIDCLDELR